MPECCAAASAPADGGGVEGLSVAMNLMRCLCGCISERTFSLQRRHKLFVLRSESSVLYRLIKTEIIVPGSTS